jgi:hypothetical protein
LENTSDYGDSRPRDFGEPSKPQHRAACSGFSSTTGETIMNNAEKSLALSTEQGPDRAISEARREAMEAVAEWRTAKAAAAEKRARLGEAQAEAAKNTAPYRSMAPATRLTLVELELSYLEAEDEASLACSFATAACDRADVLEGAEFAVACDLARVRAELGELVSNSERKRAELASCGEAERTYIARLRNAWGELEQARRRNGFPPPLPLPRPDPSLGASLGQALLEKIGARLQDGPPHVDKTRLTTLRRERTEVAAELEQSRLDREQAAKDAAVDKERRRADAEQEAQRKHKEHDALVAKHQADNAKREALAAQYRAGGSPPTSPTERWTAPRGTSPDIERRVDTTKL